MNARDATGSDPGSDPLDAPASSVPEVARDDVTLVEGRSFVISGFGGDIDAATHGFVHEDVRILSGLRLVVPGCSLVPLIGRSIDSLQGLFVHRIVDSATGAVLPAVIVRRRLVLHALREHLEVRYWGHEPIPLRVEMHVDADFAHIFDVKAGLRGIAAAQLEPAGAGWVLRAPGDDRSVCSIATTPSATADLDDLSLRWDLELQPHLPADVVATFEAVDQGAVIAFPDGIAPRPEVVAIRNLPVWRAELPAVESTDARLGPAVEQALADLAALRIVDPHHPDRVVVAAGAPWFMTLFGRDALLTAWMSLPFAPELTRGVLHTLADLRGVSEDTESEEEPGKILHELRRQGGGTGPFAHRSRYYGSIDATPLFVALAAEADRWGALDRATTHALAPAVDDAIDWILRALDGDDFVSYQRRNPRGLSNQGWKDSWDGITSADGGFPVGRVALVEVQGYAYAALRGAAALSETMPLRHAPEALLRAAHALRDRFEAHFWDERGYYVVALDESRPLDSITSNPGHALWTGIADEGRAHQYLETASESLWTGWGVRTLSPRMYAYDPLSYHNGSVWPHDSAILAAGAARYGRWDLVDRITDGLLDVADAHGGRPPELFAGFDRDEIDLPVPYPSACSPQAWASASTLFLVRTMLGLEPADGRPIVSRPPVADTPVVVRGLVVDGHRYDVTNEKVAAAP